MGRVQNSGIAVTLKRANTSTSFDVRAVEYEGDNIVRATLNITYVESNFYVQSGLPTSEQYTALTESIPLNEAGLPKSPADYILDEYAGVNSRYQSWVTAQPAEYASLGGASNVYSTILLEYVEFQSQESYPSGPVVPTEQTINVNQITKTCTTTAVGDAATDYESAVNLKLTELL